MPRFEFYGPRDTRDVGDGDFSWQGINMTLDKPLLQPGMYSFGQNTRCRTGRVRQRRGTIMPGDFNPTGAFGNFIAGSGVFRNPNGEEVLLVAPAFASYVWALQDGKDPYKINYSTSPAPTPPHNGGYYVEFVQSFDKVQMLRRGIPVTPQTLVWDGTGDTNHDGVAETKWEVTTLSPEGLKLVPSTFNGEPFMDRIIYYDANWPVVSARDSWFMSDVEDYSSYDDVFQSFRTNSGESDYLTRIMSYFRGSVVIFKNQSIHMGTLNQTYPVTVSQRILSRSIGSVGTKMPLMVGGDVIFLSQPNGFYRLSEVMQDQIYTLPVPISEPIQEVVDDINWTVTSQIGCSAAVDNYAFFGVARGATAQGLNCVLVYDTQRRQWESAGDTWRDPSFSFWALHVTNYNGVQRLFALDYPNSVIYLLYEGINDQLKNGIFPVPFKFESRGYIGDTPVGFKKFGRATIGIATYAPSIRVSAITDGFNEEKLLTLTPITKDRTRFYPHGHKAFDPLTDDALEQKREDYSLISATSLGPESNFAGEDFEDLSIGAIAQVPGSAPMISPREVFEHMQETLEPLLVRSFGRWCSIRVENDSGVCEVTSVGIESVPAMRTGRTAA